MAGVVPLPVKSKTRRKQWSLHDGPRSSLRLLQGQLAEDGCPEAQVALAKQLLEESTQDKNDEQEENSRLAVYWLIKASEQGHLDATGILKHCLETGQGITEHNFLDVQACLNMSQDEKLARRAARQLFNSLSAGQDFITTDQLRRRIRKLKMGRERRTEAAHQGGQAVTASKSQEEASSSDEARADWNSRSHKHCYAGEKLTEDYLVTAAANYMRGELPLVQRVLVLADPERGRLEQIGFVQRSVLHPWASAVLLYTWLLESLTRQSSVFFTMMVPSSPVHSLVLLVCYWLVGAESLAWLLAMLFFYISFGFMVISTLEILQREREFNYFRVWSQLFLSYSASPEETGGGMLNSAGAEARFLQAGLGPYARFFAWLLLHVLVHPLVSPAYVPHCELTVLATALSAITLFAFMDSLQRPDGVMLLSFALNVLARYPYEFDAVVQGWQFLDLRAPAIASTIVGCGVEFCLSYRGLLHLAVVGLLCRLGLRDGWRGVGRSLVPHCVALAWWQIAVLSAEGATRFGLLRAAFSMVGLGLCIPLAGLVLIVLPALAAAQSLSGAPVAIRASVTAALLAIPVALSWWLAQRHRHGGRLAGRCVLLLQLACGGLAITSLLFPLRPSSLLSHPIGDTSSQQQSSTPVEPLARANPNSISWDQFYEHCHKPAWESTSIPITQVACASLAGTVVSWEGYVTKVQVTRIINPLSSFLQMLPTPISSPLSCIFGERVPADCGAEKKLENQSCRVARLMGLHCQVEHWNYYEIAVTVKMKASTIWSLDVDLGLNADTSFKNFTLALQPNDRIWFVGFLELAGIGGENPTLKLDQIGCLGCQKSDLSTHSKSASFPFTLPSLSHFIQSTIQSTLSFFLGPIVRFA